MKIYLSILFLTCTIQNCAMTPQKRNKQRQQAITRVIARYNTEINLSIPESFFVSAFIFGCAQYTPLSFEHKLLTAFYAGNLYGLYNEVSITQATLGELKKLTTTDHQTILALDQELNSKLYASPIMSFMVGGSMLTSLCNHGITDVSHAITCGLLAASGLLAAARYVYAIDSHHQLSALSEKIIRE